MLIRIVDHFRNNPKRIDKLIAIKGLPKEWFFDEHPDGNTYLKSPWQPDVDKNIPHMIRHLCEPMDLTFKFSPIEKGIPGFIEHKRVLGLKIDYNTEPGREMWDQVERYIQETIPRNEKVPEPLVCAKDEHSPFETYLPRRSSQNRSLAFEPMDLQETDLTIYDEQAVQPKKPVWVPPAEPKKPVAIEEISANLKCDECPFQHKSPKGIQMHKMKKHPSKVGV